MHSFKCSVWVLRTVYTHITTPRSKIQNIFTLTPLCSPCTPSLASTNLLSVTRFVVRACVRVLEFQIDGIVQRVYPACTLTTFGYFAQHMFCNSFLPYQLLVPFFFCWAVLRYTNTQQFCLSILLLMNIYLGCFHYLTIMNKAYLNICIQIFAGRFLFSWVYLEVELLG